MSNIPTNHELARLGDDPNDRYSLFTSMEDLRTHSGTTIGKTLGRERRANSKKPGRTLEVAWDKRVPVDPRDPDAFILEYEYFMRFDSEPDQPILPAGDHLHRVKKELFTAVSGIFDVGLEDPATGEQVWVELNSNKRKPDGIPANTSDYIYVPSYIAHVVIPRSDHSVLAVLATSPNSDGDEFPYPVIPPSQ